MPPTSTKPDTQPPPAAGIGLWKVKPRIVVSRCLEIEACRYNGQVIQASLVKRLEPSVELIPVCPEVEIGLGVPRDPIRLVKLGGQARLLQPASGRDLTATMAAFAAAHLQGVGRVDGFLLKSRSPSCGIRDAKIYGAVDSGPALGRRAGLYARAVLDRRGHTAVEDEGRLTNYRIRHHFLTRVFASAALGQVRSPSDLVSYHTSYKLLWMAYGQAAMRRLGRLVADPKARPLAQTLGAYEAEMGRMLAFPARRVSHINVLMHAVGYFSKHLTGREKRHFHDLLEDYRQKRQPLAAALSVVQTWIARFEEPYLWQQRYFRPYPQELIDLGDSGGTSPDL